MQHIALGTNRLEATHKFYTEVLGLSEVRCNLETGHLWVNLAEGFVLRFDRVDEAPDPSALVYLGLELENFAAVDERFSRVILHTSIERDWREEYRHKQGPYGFIVRDPNGYRIKVFKYNVPESSELAT
jgi:catechol 2,3-dioxygenase-like lactoylglutathione lyase family enzyme